jgi:hypothetical protein
MTTNAHPDFYNKEVKELKLKVRKAYNRRKSGQQYREELKPLSKQLSLTKQNAQETFLRTVLKNEGNCWTEFYKHVKRRKGKRENIPAIKDVSGRFVTDLTEKANTLNIYYSLVFSCERSVPQIQHTTSRESFILGTKIEKISSDR